MSLNTDDLLLIEYDKGTYSIPMKAFLHNTFAMPEDIAEIENQIQILINYIDEQSNKFGETHPTKAEFERIYEKKINIQNSIDNPNNIKQAKLTSEISKLVTKAAANASASDVEDKGKGIIGKAKYTIVETFGAKPAETEG